MPNCTEILRGVRHKPSSLGISTFTYTTSLWLAIYLLPLLLPLLLLLLLLLPFSPCTKTHDGCSRHQMAAECRVGELLTLSTGTSVVVVVVFVAADRLFPDPRTST